MTCWDPWTVTGAAEVLNIKKHGNYWSMVEPLPFVTWEAAGKG